MNRIRLEGLYDLTTFQKSQELGLRDFSFDFRPRSFNFLQLHKFLEMMSTEFNSLHRYTLHFEREADFVVKNAIKEIDQHLRPQPFYQGFAHHFKLEFSDLSTRETLDQFEAPFYWHYYPEASLKDFLNAQNLRGIVLNFDFLHQRHKEGTFGHFFNHFYQIAPLEMKARGMELILRLDWNSDLFPSLFDFIDFDLISLCINPKVETHYRNVDLTKATETINYYKTYQF